MREYIIKPDYVSARVEGAAAAVVDSFIAKARKAWKPLSLRGDKVGFCGNFASGLAYDVAAGVVVRRKDYSLPPGTVGVYQAISSALMLYRLACVFKPIVQFKGREAYKCTWSAAFRNKALGIDILFYEWKGALTIGLRLTGSGQFSEAQYAAALDLINLLLAPNLTHPYDGVVAGSVA